MKNTDEDFGPFGPRLTPKAALGPDRFDEFTFGEIQLKLRRPQNTEHLLDHPDIHYAFAQDEYLPYWPELWPAARMLSEYLVRKDAIFPAHSDQNQAPGEADQANPPRALDVSKALELGCGLGLPGLIALKLGYQVTFTDYDGMALEYALSNAELNHLTGASALFLDWRKPPEGLRIDLILGSDLLYEPVKVQPLARIIDHLLAPDGLALISDPDRGPAKRLASELYLVGLTCEPVPVKLVESPDKVVSGTIYRIRRAKK